MASASGSADLRPYVPGLAPAVERAGGRLSTTGSVLFADLSGFTRLTERLAAGGRDGAERLTELVNAAFTALLDPVLKAGGEIIAFGGDSATVVYVDDDHERRAVASAAAMQRAIDALGGTETDAGRVRLRMSIGVASGPVDVVALGVRQRCLVLLGPAADLALALEARARPGHVLVAAATAGAVTDALVEEVDRVAGELRWQRSWSAGDDVFSTHAVVARETVGVDDTDRWVPLALRGQLGGEVDELRRCAVAFVRADPLAGPAATREQSIATCLGLGEAVEEAAVATGVCWVQTDRCPGGVTFLLAAGAPTAREDDIDRMRRTVSAIVAATPTGAVRVGAELARVFAGDIGHPRRRTWSLMGDGVNVAARLAAGAGAGTVLVGSSFAAETAAAATPAVGSWTVKGRHAPLQVHRLLVDGASVERADHDRAARAAAYVGRDEQRWDLVTRWLDATRGRGGAVEVVGDPGAGKSRLLQELAQFVRSDGDDRVTVSLVAARPDQLSVPYGAVADLVRTMAGIAPDAPPVEAGLDLDDWIRATAPHLSPWASLVADAARASLPTTDQVARLDPAWAANRRHGAIAELLELRHPRPWLLLVDELRWLDGASRALLDTIAASATTMPWLLCSARRPEQTALHAGAGSVSLGPLEPDEAARLVLDVAGTTPISDAAITEIVQTGQGNPFFVEQLTAHTLAGEPELPDTLERLVAARIDLLAPEDRSLLCELSAVGLSATLAEVALLLEDQALAEPDRWRGLAHFVDVVFGVVRIRDALVREVAHDRLPHARRRVLHGRMAEIVLDQVGPAVDDRDAGITHDDIDDDRLGLVAYHLLESGDVARAWPAAVAAARRAVTRAAWTDAASLYEQALALGERRRGAVSDADLATVHEEHGTVCQALGRLEDALAAHTKAARLATDPVAVARLCSHRADIEQLRGELRKALLWGTRGRRILEGRTDAAARRVRARLAVDQAGTRHYQGRHHESLAWAERAMVEAEGLDDPVVLGTVHLHLEMAHSVLRTGRAAFHGVQAIGCFEEAEDDKALANALINVGLTAKAEGRWGDAEHHYEHAMKVIDRTGNVTQGAVLSVNRAFLFLQQGEVDDAGALARDAARVLRAGGHDAFVGYTELIASVVARWTGDMEDSRARLAAARAMFERDGARQMVLECDVSGVELCICEGAAAAAADGAAAVIEQLADVGPAELLPVTARRLHAVALLRLGDVERALDAAGEAVELARAADSAFELALALDALAHGQIGSMRPPDPGVLAERDELLDRLRVRRTLFPRAR